MKAKNGVSQRAIRSRLLRPSDASVHVLFYAGVGGSGGFIRYCAGLLRPGAIPREVDVTLVATTALVAALGELDPRVRIVVAEGLASRWRARRYYWHLFTYPAVLRRVCPDVEFYASGELRTLWRRPVAVATCHNLLLFDEDELLRYRSTADRGSFRRSRVRQMKSFARATGVIFLSEYSRHAVSGALTTVRPSTVVAHGTDVEEFATERDYDLGETIRLLCVSSIHHYKNHPYVVREVRRVREQMGLRLQLRIVGPAHIESLQDLRETIVREQAEDFVVVQDTVSMAALPSLLATADLFVFASSCETFGLSLLEAMAAGLPIACSSRSGLPELAGDGALYFDPRIEGELAKTIERLLTGRQLRERVGRSAAERAKAYTWERCAKETYEFIAQCRRMAGTRRAV